MTKKKSATDVVVRESDSGETVDSIERSRVEMTRDVRSIIQTWAEVSTNLWLESMRVLFRGAANAVGSFSPSINSGPARAYPVVAELLPTPSDLRVENFVSRSDTPGNVGVCLSGGGSRAMIAAMGQLRGLHAMGLLNKVKALSTVSGGSWAAVPFTYLPDFIPDENFLNVYVADPAELTPTGWHHRNKAAALDFLPVGNLGHVAAQLSMGSVELTLAALDLHFVQGVPSDLVWSHLIGANVLGPFGLSEFDEQNLPASFFTHNEQMAQEILQKNPSLPKTFHVYRQPASPAEIIRPFHVCNTSMFIKPQDGSSINRADGLLLAPVQSTAFFTGILGTGIGTDMNGRPVGGGSVSSYAFGSQVESLPGDRQVLASQLAPLSLSDITGMSSAFFASTLAEALPELSALDPERSYWPVANPQPGDGSRSRFADGGGIADNGVASILAYNDIDNLIVFVNSTKMEEDRFGNVKIDPWLPTLFGFTPYQAGPSETTSGYFRYEEVARQPDLLNTQDDLFFQHNQVFPSSDFAALLDHLWANSGSGTNENPAVFYQKGLDVLPNNWFGVKGGRKVNVLWVVLNPVQSWTNQLRPEVQEILSRDFPNYNILHTHQAATDVNLLAHLTAWTICQQTVALAEMFTNSG